MTDRAAPPPLDELLARREWVRRFARTLARDDFAADDLAQDAWVAAVETPPRPDAPAGWFRRVLLHRAMNRSRGEQRRAAHESAAARPDVAPSTADVVAAAESHRRVVEAVMALDEPYRATVLLRFFEDLPPRDVAARMGVPVETVRSRVRRAVEQLRARLDEESGGRRAAWLAPLLGARSQSASPTHVAPIAKGVIVMTTAKKLAAIAAVLLLLLAGGAVVWTSRVIEHRATETSDAPAPREASRVAARASSKPRRSAAGESSTSTTADAPSGSSAAPTPPADATPAATQTLLVKVVDTDGRPVAGAIVATIDRDGLTSPTAHRLMTDAGGTARFTASSPFVTASLDGFRADGDALATESSTASSTPARRNRVPSGCREFTIVVRRCASISGVVVDETGRPFDRATVWVLESGRTRGSFSTVDHGLFQFAVPKDGRFDLLAAGAPLAGARGAADELVGEARDVPAGQSDVTIVVKPVAAKATLRLRAATSDGRPLANVGLSAVTPSGWTPVVAGRTDAEGRLAFADVPARPLLVRVDTPYPKNPEWNRDGWITPLDRIVRPGEGEIVLVFAAGRPVRGHVVAPENSGIATWQIAVVAGSEQVSTAFADAAGLFEVLVPADASGPLRLTTGVRDTRTNRTFEGETGDVRAGDQGVELRVEEVK